MIIGIALGGNNGMHPGAWRRPEADPNVYTNINAHIKHAKIAEEIGLDFVFFPDRVFLKGDITHTPPTFAMDPLLMLSIMAHETKRIGVVASASTSFNEPYTLARQFRALDLISNGRAGWNAIPSYEREAFANYGKPMPQSDVKYERLNETLYITQALWGSWQKEAGVTNPQTGIYANMDYIKPVNLQGKHVGSRGPLQLPPSEQGQPVIFMPLASDLGLQSAAQYADVVFGMPNSLEESKSHREYVRKIVKEAGRTPDDVKYLAFLTYGVGKTHRDALNRRRVLEEHAGLRDRLAQLSQLLGYRIDVDRADIPFTPDKIGKMYPSYRHSGAKQAIELARDGWSPIDILAHGVLDVVLNYIGSGEGLANMMEEWVEAGACDGFMLTLDDQEDGISDFGKYVMPFLRNRELRAESYSGKTLRNHLGISEQLGVDPRIQ